QDIYHAKPDDPLFVIRQGSSVHPLSATEFTRYLHLTLKAANLNSRLISIHSFRKGAATFASSIGISAAELKALAQLLLSTIRYPRRRLQETILCRRRRLSLLRLIWLIFWPRRADVWILSRSFWWITPKEE